MTALPKSPLQFDPFKVPSTDKVYRNAIHALIDDHEVAEAVIKTKMQYLRPKYHNNFSKYNWSTQVDYANKKGGEALAVWGCYCVAYHNTYGKWPEERREMGDRGKNQHGFHAPIVLRFLKSFKYQSACNSKTLVKYFAWYLDEFPRQMFWWALECQKIRQWLKNMKYFYHEMVEVFCRQYAKKHGFDYYVSMPQRKVNIKCDNLEKAIQDAGGTMSDYFSWFFWFYQERWDNPLGLGNFVSDAAMSAYKTDRQRWADSENYFTEAVEMSEKINKGETNAGK